MGVLKRESFEKFNYLLRPSKQVERKLFIEALQRMVPLGYPIAEYAYVGLGSVYYADFMLFHKYLYIDDMYCVEASNIPKRMDFNRPFDFIKLRMQRVAEFLPEVERDRMYFVWLDYDTALTRDVIRDIEGFLHVLAPKSIFIVTVDAEPRLPEEPGYEDLTQNQRVEKWLAALDEDLGSYYGETIRRSVFSPVGLPRFLTSVLRSAIAQAMSERPSLRFLQLFNFRYADGAQMLSLGGLIDDPRSVETVRGSHLFKLGFVTDGPEPIEVSVPPLTVREKQWLDRRVVSESASPVLEFELQEQLLENFRRYYRHYPTYHETVV